MSKCLYCIQICKYFWILAVCQEGKWTVKSHMYQVLHYNIFSHCCTFEIRYYSSQYL